MHRNRGISNSVRNLMLLYNIPLLLTYYLLIYHLSWQRRLRITELTMWQFMTLWAVSGRILNVKAQKLICISFHSMSSPFPYRKRYFGDLRHLQLMFSSHKPRGFSISGLFRLFHLQTYKLSHVLHNDVDNFHKVWSLYGHALPNYIVLAAVTLRFLVTFDLLTLDSGHTWRTKVVNISTMLEDLKLLRFWLTSYDITHRTPLTMHLQPTHMRHTMWPIWNPWPKMSSGVCQNSALPCVKDHTTLCTWLPDHWLCCFETKLTDDRTEEWMNTSTELKLSYAYVSLVKNLLCNIH